MKTVLFYGDSITDGNRYKDEKDRGDLDHQMGHSYAYVINALLGSRYPEKNLHFLNRGISGNRVLELYGRFYEDVVALKPDVVSILVELMTALRPSMDVMRQGEKLTERFTV